ncbi:helix-turn-helix domain-containing protein [Nocardia sp. NBC_00565]|uniref:helix-turn-helix domain-containing protein n=1 Tax=Nocardia sp. NBC_00565 TaxID=2975993 RepID=UPI002E818AC2|nr:helix-turn-helix transcriptional regulator [Nocardia sp. NBC_00565]WUC03135.1 helix-turn-helix domain-containing protein [Nocardia sp. NBC_00565]
MGAGNAVRRLPQLRRHQVTNAARDAREALGQRLREIRRRAGLSGRQLAALADWHESKISKLEYGKLRASDADVRAYCAHAGAEDELADLLATLHNIDAAYMEMRRLLSTGTGRSQDKLVKLAEKTRLTRTYQNVLIPGILQTPEYARAILERSITRHRLPDDIDAGIAKRMERQQFLYHGDRRFHVLLAEQALLTTVGNDSVMIGQLDRLLVAAGLPRVTLGIVPAAAEIPQQTTNFVMFDDRMTTVETITAELTITQPREIATYGRTFDMLAELSVTGDIARALILAAVDRRRTASQ